eukprot:960580_1
MHMLTIPSIAIIAYGFSLICTRLNYAYVIISPTMSDVDTEYYFSNTSDEFEWGYILCAAEKPNCEIKCHADSTCEWLTVNASLTQNLLLECDGSDACRWIDVYGPNVSANVQCISPDSCGYGEFQFDDTKRVNINCDGWSDSSSSSYACSYSEITQNLLLECDGSDACRWIDVYGPNVSANVQCISPDSCGYGEFQFDDTKRVNINCDGWSDSGSSSYACGYSEINAAMAEDVNIQCMGQDSCYFATLNGTFVSNSILAQCNDRDSCNWLVIHGLHTQEVNVFCKDTDTVSYSCQDLTVYCPSE